MEIALRCRPRSEPCFLEARVVIALDEVNLYIYVKGVGSSVFWVCGGVGLIS